VIAVMGDVTKLRSLDLQGNPVSEVKGYRDEVFALIGPKCGQFEVLDGEDREGEEVNISENLDQEGEEYDMGDRADGGEVLSDQSGSGDESQD
jgi:hypothetical protein